MCPPYGVQTDKTSSSAVKTWPWISILYLNTLVDIVQHGIVLLATDNVLFNLVHRIYSLWTTLYSWLARIFRGRAWVSGRAPPK